MNRKIKICIIIHGFCNDGIEKVMSNYFMNMDRSKYDLHAVAYKEPDLRKQQIFEDMGFKVHQLSKFIYHAPQIKNVLEHWRLFKRERFDVIHNNCPENLLPTVIGTLLKTRVRIVHSHVDYTNGFKDKSFIKKLLYNIGLKVVAANATEKISCSKAAGISVFGQKAVINGEVKIIYNAIDTFPFTYQEKIRNIYRSKLGVVNETLVGHVGRLDGSAKNQEFVINTFAMYKMYDSTAKLVFIGEGSLRKKYEEIVVDMGLEDSVIFTGSVLNVCDYYQAMDIFLFPSHFEGLGIVLIEAQCSGLPCLASDRVPEEAFVNSNAVSLPLEAGYDKWVIKMKELLKSGRVKNGEILRAENYKIEHNVAKLEKLYQLER